MNKCQPTPPVLGRVGGPVRSFYRLLTGTVRVLLTRSGLPVDDCAKRAHDINFPSLNAGKVCVQQSKVKMTCIMCGRKQYPFYFFTFAGSYRC